MDCPAPFVYSNPDRNHIQRPGRYKYLMAPDLLCLHYSLFRYKYNTSRLTLSENRRPTDCWKNMLFRQQAVQFRYYLCAQIPHRRIRSPDASADLRKRDGYYLQTTPLPGLRL